MILRTGINNINRILSNTGMRRLSERTGANFTAGSIKNTVGDIASRDIISLTVDTSLRDAAAIIAEKSIKGAPVMKKGKAVGMLSVTDIVLAVAEGKENLSAGDVMSDNVYIVDEDMKIANAVDIMFKKGLGRLVVADKDNDILGIVTRTDLIESLANLKQFPIFAGKK